MAEENKDSLFYDAWRVWFRYFVSMGYAGWNELWEAVCIKFAGIFSEPYMMAENRISKHGRSGDEILDRDKRP